MHTHLGTVPYYRYDHAVTLCAQIGARGIKDRNLCITSIQLSQQILRIQCTMAPIYTAALTALLMFAAASTVFGSPTVPFAVEQETEQYPPYAEEMPWQNVAEQRPPYAVEQFPPYAVEQHAPYAEEQHPPYAKNQQWPPYAAEQFPPYAAGGATCAVCKGAVST